MDEEQSKKYEYWKKYIKGLKGKRSARKFRNINAFVKLEDYIIEDGVNKDKNIYKLVFLELEGKKSQLSKTLTNELHHALRNNLDEKDDRRGRKITVSMNNFTRHTLPNYHKKAIEAYESKSL